jgi:uncharacterized tellurite resistance protein B-like protein
MFESIKSWFEAMNEHSEHFDHKDEEAVHVALASLLYHIISVDNLQSDKEKHLFSSILREEFNLNSEQVISLYDQVKTLETDFHQDLATISEHLVKNPHLKMSFMEKLIHLMSVDGITEKELVIFNDAIKVVFPEIPNADDNF